MTVYRVHGLRMDSEIPLGAPVADQEADLVVRWGDPAPAGEGPPEGEVVASVREDGVAYTVARSGDVLRLRLHGTAEFVVEPGSITVHMDPAADPGLAAVLLTGNVPAVIHTAAGVCVLHASAVAFDDGALAFVGGSGAGKSTLSALCCAAGAALVSEDLLRIRFEGDRPMCLPGIPVVRLRPGAAALAEAFPPASRGESADARTTVELPEAAEAPLVALLLPEPAREVRAVEAVRLAPGEALVELGRYPRVLGWRTPEVRAARFRTLARLARAVPVVRVRIPWGPPFPPDLAGDLRAAARAAR